MNSNWGRRSVPAWYVLLLAALAAGVIIFAITQIGAVAAAKARTSTEDVTAQNGVVQVDVSGSGEVEPGLDDTLNFGTSGTLQTVDVKVGQVVKKGQLIATLDPSSAELTLTEAQASLTEAEDSLTTLEDEESASSSSGATASAAAAGSGGSGSGASGSGGSGSKGGSYAGNSGSANSNSGSSGNGSETTTTATVTKPTAAEIQQAEVAVDAAEATVDADEKAVTETKLYAPASGRIASLSSTAIGATVSGGGGSAASSTSSESAATDVSGNGGSTGTGSGFAELINDKTMTMSVSVSEDDISTVKVGQMATVSINALSGVELAGHVTSISPLGSDSSGVVSYTVTVTVTQNNPKVLPGMSATATIVTQQAQGVTVPNEAISGAGSDATVQLVEGKKVVAQPVVVGLKGADRSQILSGLKAGQEVQVTITLPSLGTTTTSSSSSTSGSGRFGGFGGGGFGGGGGFSRFFGGGGGGAG